ncbi:hypothetical protein ACFQ0M_08020 [Kitasatospora aburaviensis]
MDLGKRTASALASRLATYDALSRAAVSGRGEAGILQTLHERTGFATLTEDSFGNPRAWAGPCAGAPERSRQRNPPRVGEPAPGHPDAPRAAPARRRPGP